MRHKHERSQKGMGAMPPPPQPIMPSWGFVGTQYISNFVGTCAEKSKVIALHKTRLRVRGPFFSKYQNKDTPIFSYICERIYAEL